MSSKRRNPRQPLKTFKNQVKLREWVVIKRKMLGAYESCSLVELREVDKEPIRMWRHRYTIGSYHPKSEHVDYELNCFESIKAFAHFLSIQPEIPGKATLKNSR